MLVIHLGAGNHDRRKTKSYKKLIIHALKANQPIIPTSSIIEKSPLTNTGYGSCLNMLGEVECDASILVANRINNTVSMKSLIGINDSLYPISTTATVFSGIESLYNRTNTNQFGITMPIKLSYQSFSKYQNFQLPCSNRDLVSPSAQTFYDTYQPKISLQSANNVHETYQPQISLLNSSNSLCDDSGVGSVTDTIGLLEIDQNQTTIATSLGGNFFKVPGRIGCAGEIGSSIDFYRNTLNCLEISCLCSGNGEDIMQMKLSHYIVNNFDINQNHNWGENLVNLIQNHLAGFDLFGKSKFNDDSILYVGVIVIINNIKDNWKRLIYCHSTESFYFGFRTDDQKVDPNVVFSHLDDSSKVGKTFAYGEFKC